MAEYSTIGKSVTKLDALDKVTGKAKYCIDMRLSSMLYGTVLRSPYAHARIIDVNTSKGFGLMLVNMLCDQLRGSFQIEDQNGTKSTLKFDI